MPQLGCTDAVVSLCLAIFLPMFGFEGILLRKTYPFAYKITLAKWATLLITIPYAVYKARNIDKNLSSEDYNDEVMKILKDNKFMWVLYFVFTFLVLASLFAPINLLIKTC